MESLLCDEVWLSSPNLQEDDECCKNDEYSSFLFFSTKEDCEEVFSILLGKEKSYMPESGYLELIRTNYLIRNARFKAVNWIVKSQRRMNITLGTVFIAVSYLDRFISKTQCQGWKCRMFDLLSVACLSVATKYNETNTHHLLKEFQEGVDNSLAPGLIQRMELTLLKALDWRMDSTTSFSYVELMIQSIDDALSKTLVEDLTERVAELLLIALLDPEFMEFRQSVIAVSAVRCVFDDLFPSKDNDSSLAHLDILIPQDQKDNLIKCQRIMAKLLVDEDQNMLACGNSNWHDPSSPVTVLHVDFYEFPVDLSLMKMPMNMDLRSAIKRKRE